MSDTQTTTNDNPVQEQEVSTILGSGGDNQDWRSTLPDELKNDATLQNFKDIESLAKTVVHQQKVLGSRIPLPKNDDEYNELYNKLGRPEDPNKYEVKIPQEYEQYFKKENVDEFKNVAHKIGLNNKQVNALLDYQVNSIKYEMQNEPASIAMEKDKTEQMPF